MSRRTDVPARLVLASGNAGKLRELQALLKPLELDVRPQSDWGLPEAIEDGLTFLENALIKARHAARLTGEASLADDSGLVVPALDGAPGIYSARYSTEPRGDGANNAKLLKDMAGLTGADRAAHFHCTVVLMRSAEDPVPLVASADWWGRVAEAPRGDGGFGYDPLFEVPGTGLRSAELAPEEKNLLSHRGQALRRLLDLLTADAGE